MKERQNLYILPYFLRYLYGVLLLKEIITVWKCPRPSKSLIKSKIISNVWLILTKKTWLWIRSLHCCRRIKFQSLWKGLWAAKTRWLYKCNFRHKIFAYGIYLLNKVQCYWKKTLTNIQNRIDQTIVSLWEG